MTNEDISKQIATGNRCYYPDANDFQDYKERYSAALAMAEWKDQQLREYLEKRKKQESHITGCASYQYGRRRIIDEIINDLFPKTEEQDNSDRDE